MHSDPTLVISVVVIMVAASIVYGFVQARKRTEALGITAQKIGFTFEGDDWTNPAIAPVLGTALFRRGNGGRSSNIMTGVSSGLRTSLFDYSYTTSGGKNSSTHTQTVAAFSQSLRLPIFELRPEGFLDRIGEAFVRHDIDFDSYPAFSKRYFLRGPVEPAIRALFSPSLIAFMEQLPAEEKWHIEGLDTMLVLYRSDTLVDADKFQAFLDKTSGIAKTFFTSAIGLSKPMQ
jgi:hypothetical protein